MKKSIIVSVIVTLLLTVTAEAAVIHGYKFYKNMVKKQQIGKVREYWTENLTAEMLEKRGDDVIIEKTIGTVLNKKKDGAIMGVDKSRNYISYRSVKGAKKGDTVLTIFIYTPGNSYTDDICERFDYIIDRAK